MATTKINIDEDIFDVANRVYGHPLGVIWLVEDNNLSGITATVVAEQSLEIRNATVELIPIQAIKFIQGKSPDYLIDEYQSIFDLAIEKHGSIEGVFSILEENGYDGITEYLWAKRAIKVNANPINPRLKTLLANFMPIATIEPTDKSDGIGFMYIERNFIVR